MVTLAMKRSGTSYDRSLRQTNIYTVVLEARAVEHFVPDSSDDDLDIEQQGEILYVIEIR